MAVLKKKHKNSFTVIDNGVFGSNLSLKARGLLCTMLSLPDGWNFSEKGLQAILPADGQCSVRSAVKELEEGGWLTRERLCDDKGKIVEWVWTFSDYQAQAQKPQEDSADPHRENPDLENPNLDSPSLGNPRQLNTKEAITKEESKKESNTEEPREAAEQKLRYGEFANVLLTDSELARLKKDYPRDWSQRIERLSSYKESTGKRYRSDYATIRGWAQRDAKRAAGSAPASAPKLAAAPAVGSGKSAVPAVEEVMERYAATREEAERMIRYGLW